MPLQVHKAFDVCVVLIRLNSVGKFFQDVAAQKEEKQTSVSPV